MNYHDLYFLVCYKVLYQHSFQQHFVAESWRR